MLSLSCAQVLCSRVYLCHTLAERLALRSSPSRHQHPLHPPPVTTMNDGRISKPPSRHYEQITINYEQTTSV